MGFYDDMADVATDVLGEFKQDMNGGKPILLRRPSASTPGANSFDRPTQGTPADTTLSASVLAAASDKASMSYVDGKTILGSDLTVTCAVFGFDPAMTDFVVVNNKPRLIKKILQIPASGTPVVWKLIVEG